MEYILVDGKRAEIVAKADDFSETIKLEFLDAEEIYLRGEGGGIFGDGSKDGVRVVSIIFDINIKEIEGSKLLTKITTSYGVAVNILSERLIVTKI